MFCKNVRLPAIRYYKYRFQVNSKLFYRQKNVPQKIPRSPRNNGRKLYGHLVRVVRNVLLFNFQTHVLSAWSLGVFVYRVVLPL